MNPYLAITCMILAISNVAQGQNSVQKLSIACNSFSQILYQRIASNKLNVVYSPYSIHQALSMTLLGARRGTQREMNTTLRLNNFDTDSPHEAYNQVIVQHQRITSVNISTANALFVNPSRTIKPTYRNDVTRFYQANVTNYDLSYPGGPEEQINDFVEYKTNGLIKDLLQKGTIDGNTILILINTLLFNGTWEKRFLVSRTNKSDFFAPDGTRKVDTMFDDRTVNMKRNYYNANIVQLNFTGGEFSLYFVVPKKNISDFEKLLTRRDRFANIFTGLQPTFVKLSVPKMKIESTLKLKEDLIALGMQQAFDQARANFQGITDESAVISDVVHKALIDITERGTIAAAATAVEVSVTSLPPVPKESFKVDRPCLIFLKDNIRDLVLFQAKYSGN